MDPNHWNTYNLQYGHSTSGGLPPTHPSLNRLDLTSGLSLSHSLQATHGSLSARTMPAIPAVNYPTLGMPLLDHLGAGISTPQSHKTMALAQSQLVFEPQMRMSTEQQSPSISRYDSSKPFRTDVMSRSQLLEAAAARAWGTSNFSPSSLYNQFGSLLPEAVPPSSTTLSSSPASGSNTSVVSKSNQLQLHEPPPAHSSNTARLSSIQRTPHSSEILYGRSTESLIPSSLAQFTSLYSPAALGKPNLSNSQQQLSINRQTPIHVQQSFSTHSDIEDLSSNSQSQLYGSYANLSVTDSQDFTAAQLSGEMSYEAVSPAPPLNESSQGNSEHTTFSIVQFPDLANLTSEQAHTIVDKFQENDFRLKIDSRVEQQQHQQDALASPHSAQRQESNTPLKIPKDLASVHSPMLNMQMNQRSSQFQLNMTVSQSIPQLQSGVISISQLAQHTALTTASMQQPPAPLPVQALADSTTKPKRSRSRKKKGETNPPTCTSPASENKKSTPPQASPTTAHQQGTHPSSHILNMPPTSPHISTLPMGSHMSQNSQMQQQQQGYRNPGSNQYTSRDAQRAQTPSMPHNYSIQDHQGHGYTPVPSPKLSNENVIHTQGEFALPVRVANDKSSSSTSYKQQQRKPNDSALKSNNNQSNQLYRSNIPEHQQHMQNFAGLMGSGGQQRGSPMQDGRVGMTRMHSFEHSPQQKLGSHMSPLGQPSPQGNVTDTNTFNASKIGSNQMMISQPPVTLAQPSPMGSRPVSVEPTGIPHGYEQSHQPALIENQDPSQFQIDFTGQPFLEQLVGVQPPMAIPSASFTHSTSENGEVVFTTLVTPAENARLHQHQQQDSTESDSSFRPTYHGEAVHEIRPIGPIGGHMGMEEVTFNAFFDNQRELEQQGSVSIQPPNSQEATPEPDRMSLTFVPHVVEDDELSHFSQLTMTQPVPMIKKESLEAKVASKDSFQDSFLSYLQGHKQETLSSVSSSAVTKKPQLPKYIPEPRRPRPPQPKESLQLSDTEDGMSTVHSKVKDLISSFSDNDNCSQKSESDREGYSVQRTSELAVKITLPKNKKKSKFGPFAESSLLKDSIRNNREGMLKRRRKKGKHRDSEGDDYLPGHLSEEDAGRQKQELQLREPTPPPMRASIGRKAKDKCLEKTKKRKKHSGSDSSADEVAGVFSGKVKGDYRSDVSDKNYDSDKDPVWMPFDVDLNQGHDFDDKRKKIRRPRMRTSSTKTVKGSGSHKSSTSTGAALNVAAYSMGTDNSSHMTDTSGLFKVGMYVIEKKDLQNYESYPIWRLEPGNMIRKFELKMDGGVVRHQAVGTFSTWVSSMDNQFELVRVRDVPGKSKGDSGLVEVLEECRPKPSSDGRLELQYENDPLVEPFNIYLQVFLSQALEPTFLSAILETNEKFYVDALSQIDGMVDSKCQSIARLAHWKASFQDWLHKCPLMKEIDRPNLKQACQASENSSPPTIKSVILSGNSYDRFLLTENASQGPDVAQEFMIGKVAAYYVRTYHSLYHFKYWLRQRCEAKVKMMKESNKSENLTDEVILDKCLENRQWVLQLFDNLKNLFKYGGETPR